MVHPMYHKCLRLVNKPVTVHLVDGRRHYGTIQNVTQSGVYFLPMSGNRPASASDMSLKAETADNQEHQETDAREVFFAPFFFLPFGLLAGFTLGFATGALIPRYPYYPPPYGPYYW